MMKINGLVSINIYEASFRLTKWALRAKFIHLPGWIKGSFFGKFQPSCSAVSSVVEGKIFKIHWSWVQMLTLTVV